MPLSSELPLRMPPRVLASVRNSIDFTTWCAFVLAMVIYQPVSAEAKWMPSTSRSKPSLATNLTVISLRPANLSSSLVDKDSGDAAGDLFFWITDRLVAPYACRVSNGKWWGCSEQKTLDHDSVYTQTVLEVDGTWPSSTSLGSCDPQSLNSSYSCFAACNPVSSDGTEWHCACRNSSTGQSKHHAPCDIVGRENMMTRYAHSPCADGCHYTNDYWKPAIANIVKGMWYSTPAQAHCGDPNMVTCRWRELSKLKVVNASCANENVLNVVRNRGKACYSTCSPDDRANPTSDCSVECFFETVIGRGKLFPNSTLHGTPGSVLVDAFLAAFTTEDPSKGGCPDLRIRDDDSFIDTKVDTKKTRSTESTMMKAVRASHTVEKEGDFSTISVEMVAIPRPSIGEVLINVSASSVNPVDWKILLQGSGLPIRFPHTLGFDVAGTIASIGPGVTRLAVGDEVWADLGEMWPTKGGELGAYAEFALAKEEQVGKKPTKVSMADAASLPLVALTSFQALRETGAP